MKSPGQIIAATALGLMLATAVVAQETEIVPGAAVPEAAAEAAAGAADAPATDDPAAAADSEAAGDGDSTGTLQPAEVGDPAAPDVMEVVRDTFQDWEVRCAPDGDECFLYQLAMDAENNPVAEFSMVRLPAGGEAAAGVTVVTPLGTLLPAGVVMQVDTGEQRQYPFSWCSQVGCFARFGIKGDSIAAMKRGNAAKVTLVSVAAPDQPITLQLSLKGFTAAHDSLTPIAPE